MMSILHGQECHFRRHPQTYYDGLYQMNLTLLSALNFFRKKNRFRITAKLAEKTARSTVRPNAECAPLGSPEYHLSHMELTDADKEDFLTNLQKDAHELKHARDAAVAAKSRWHKNKYTQEYQLDKVELNPQIEIYYQKLGLGQTPKKTRLGDHPELNWEA